MSLGASIVIVSVVLTGENCRTRIISSTLGKSSILATSAATTAAVSTIPTGKALRTRTTPSIHGSCPHLVSSATTTPTMSIIPTVNIPFACILFV